MTGRNLGTMSNPDVPRTKTLFKGVAFDGSQTDITIEAFDRRADALARALVRAGLRRGERLAILAVNSLDYLVVLCGALRAGIVPVPVNFKFPGATIAFILADSDVKMVFCDRELRNLLPVLPTPLPVVEFGAALEAFLDEGSFEAVEPAPGELALILYTSGSTGRPKGVLLSHDAHRWVARTRVAEYGLRDEIVLIAAPLYHMNALALALLVMLSGATAVILPFFKATAYIEAIDRFRCTWLTAVPPMIAMMLREREALARADLSCVRTIRMGSAPVTDALLAEIERVIPNGRVINAYGTSEAGPVVFGSHPDGRETPAGAMGYPHPEVELRLAGPEAPTFGTLQMKSPGMMLGYLNRPEIQPFTPDGFYDTGDLFRRDADDFYTFVGRADDMFVSGGENIYPSDVESVIESHAGVRHAAVVPVRDEVKGTKPVAFVVPRTTGGVREEDIKSHVLANAPAYQYPRYVWMLDAMPLAVSGKLDRRALKALAEEKMAAIRDE